MVCFQGFCRASPRLQTESLKTPHFNLQSSKSDFFQSRLLTVQGVVQFRRNLVWSNPSVCRV